MLTLLFSNITTNTTTSTDIHSYNYMDSYKPCKMVKNDSLCNTVSNLYTNSTNGKSNSSEITAAESSTTELQTKLWFLRSIFTANTTSTEVILHIQILLLQLQPRLLIIAVSSWTDMSLFPLLVPIKLGSEIVIGYESWTGALQIKLRFQMRTQVFVAIVWQIIKDAPESTLSGLCNALSFVMG